MSNVQIEGSTTRSLLIGDSQLEEIFWNIKPTKEGVATLKTSLTSNTYPEGDTVSIKVPVKEFGFFENDSFVGKGKSEFKLRVYPDTKPSSSKAMLYVSGSLFGTLPPAIEYLLQYPYGCVEQTTSRFIPAVLFAENRSILQNKIQDKDLPDIMKKGVERLYTLENRFGGWGWWYGNTNPALTAYVIEYLKRSEAVGTNVPQEIYDTTRTGFENTLSNISSPSERIPYIYSLSLLGSPKGKSQSMEASFLFTPTATSLRASRYSKIYCVKGKFHFLFMVFWRPSRGLIQASQIETLRPKSQGEAFFNR
jgi:uncharacterized protein YfaS (alpha-2-macroglobulin family)